ncbi:diguanylate cyclase domain-containing protein [Paenibacillus solisilvae]|uniref:Diguanylate cyclase domain-containing protein n=1 Tax=Paenibacillus solisilvae TaxID=2486751 RepID=A0ABW0W2S7_9BACL
MNAIINSHLMKNSYAFGDEVLRLMAKRLLAYNEYPYNACRLGGNTFLLLHELDLQQEETDRHVELMKGSLEQVLQVRGQLLYPTCSIGISSFPRMGETAEMLIRHADTALQHAKEAGGNRISAYTGEDVMASRRMLFISEALRDAVRELFAGLRVS